MKEERRIRMTRATRGHITRSTDMLQRKNIHAQTCPFGILIESTMSRRRIRAGNTMVYVKDRLPCLRGIFAGFLKQQILRPVIAAARHLTHPRPGFMSRLVPIVVIDNQIRCVLTWIRMISMRHRPLLAFDTCLHVTRTAPQF